MSSLQKLLVSSANSRSCKSCGKQVSILWRHSLALLAPAVLVLVIMQTLDLEPWQVLLYGLIMIAIVAVIQVRYIPLSGERF